MSNLQFFQNLLAKADIKLNGSRPWDITINDEKAFDRLLKDGTLGAGESYMDGQWDCQAIDEMIARVIKAKIDTQLTAKDIISLALKKAGQKFNFQSIERTKKDVPFHYDIGNDLFEKMLDKYMTYTCGYWKNADNLDEAQQKKMELICRKLGLKPGMRILDIGCGWGSFMKYATEHYQVNCDGITLSKEQVNLGKQRCRGLPIRFFLQDYREYQSNSPYDRIVSVGMFEHCGPNNYKKFFQCANALLADNGIFLLHTIGGQHSDKPGDPWIQKYIFPNGTIPSLAQIDTALADYFVIEDLHNIGPHYDKTLLAWYKNFNDAWPALSEKYGNKFYRMWRYYLLQCAGAFRARHINVWQLALTKIGTSQIASVQRR